ncbi:unnamed protein product [Prorocentrum cordatum]|uniref:Transmembrane protein n=1 Tax=Prorocentrum cordatum TaxID=2364126 RepID=A0ABN9XL45_9DINO|nr:unnamed protein product [Polarella glacialis]|mmetsp:Transcript_26922/g.70436  ORF Transcript_26922/g.70436 Transcript_26922/m.70436 type:complete len:112 (-) Transcript_26922:270-605(-)
MARVGSRGSSLLALCALFALSGALLSCGSSFVAPRSIRQQDAQSTQTSGMVAGPKAVDSKTGQRTAMQFFSGEPTPPPKPKEKPFKLPPFFTTLASLAVVVGGCFYFLNNA